MLTIGLPLVAELSLCQAAEPGLVQLEGPASGLFSNFEVVAKQVTLLHYSDDLGIDLQLAKFIEE